MATVPAVEYLENVLAEKFDNALIVEGKTEGAGAAEGKENAAPQLPVSGKPSGLDFAGLMTKEQSGLDLAGLMTKEQSTPSKKAWNRTAAIPGTGAATSPSAASTLTPSNDNVMSVSPSSDRSCEEPAEPEKLQMTEKHTALKTLAEQYASAKKLHPSGSAELATALELVCVACAKDLHPDPESLKWDETDPEKRVAAIEQTLRDMASPHIPVVDGQLTSIGSIPYFTGGIANCVGLCRFHVKGKCFDGVLCRFSHISRERHMREGVLCTNERGDRSPENDDGSRRNRRKGEKTTPAKTPPRSQAPFAAPLLTLPTPTPMPMSMPMMQMPMPMPQMPTASKPQSREQAALCELLSSLDVQPEQPAMPPAMPNPYAYPGAMPMMPVPMMNPYAYGYDPRMMDPMYGAYYAQWQQQQQCPTVQPVQSLQAQARRKKKGI